MKVFGVLHLSDRAYKDPVIKQACKMDWAKIPSILEGSWPFPLPPFRSNHSTPELNEWFLNDRDPYIVIDTEWSPHSKQLFLIGIGSPGREGLLVGAPRIFVPSFRVFFGGLLRKLVKRVPVVFHNAMADIPIIEDAFGIKYEDYCHIDDTMLAHAVLWSEWPHTLEFLASIYGRYEKLKHLSKTNPEKYNWGDVVETISVWERMKVELQNDPLTEKIYRTQSLKVIPGILKRQRMGIRINRERVEEAKLFYSLELKRAAQLAHAYAGYPLNIGSEKQLKQYLYGIEGFKVKKLLGKATVNDEAIAALRNSVLPFDSDAELEEPLTSTEALLRCGEGAHPVLEGRVVYIGARQILTHFLAPMAGERFYPNISIHAQASGRWSIPPLTQMPKSLRDIIIPNEGMCWITWDWKSIEPRLLAAISNDTPSLEAFERGEDIYSLAAEEAFGWPSPVEDFKRLFTKRFVLRLNYGGSPWGAGSIPGAKTLGLKPHDLVQASQRYLQAHPALSMWREGVSTLAKTKRETRTFMGRRRRLLNPSLGAVERAAFNHPMQGGVVDIANTSFLEIYENLPWANFVYSMHDFQAWEVPVERKEESFELIKTIVCREWDMEGVKVKFPADFKIIGG